MRKHHRWTEEQIDYIRKIAKGKTIAEIHELLVSKFEIDVTKRAVQNIMYRNKIKNKMQGHSTRFKDGHKPWNKNKKGLNLGGEKGWFKKGDPHPNAKPIGSESVYEGIVWIKVRQPNVWRKKHRYIWEQAHGKIPKGKVLRFKDGNPMNVTLDNLFLVDKRVMTAVVRRKMEQDDPELNVLSHKVAELDLTIKEKSDV